MCKLLLLFFFFFARLKYNVRIINFKLPLRLYARVHTHTLTPHNYNNYLTVSVWVFLSVYIVRSQVLYVHTAQHYNKNVLTVRRRRYSATYNNIITLVCIIFVQYNKRHYTCKVFSGGFSFFCRFHSTAANNFAITECPKRPCRGDLR